MSEGIACFVAPFQHRCGLFSQPQTIASPRFTERDGFINGAARCIVTCFSQKLPERFYFFLFFYPENKLWREQKLPIIIASHSYSRLSYGFENRTRMYNHVSLLSFAASAEFGFIVIVPFTTTITLWYGHLTLLLGIYFNFSFSTFQFYRSFAHIPPPLQPLARE